MSKTDSYLQFPICALAYAKDDPGNWVATIIAYALVEASRKLWADLGQCEINAIVRGFSGRGRPKGFSENNPDYLALLHGADVLQITLGNIERTLEAHQRLTAFRRNHEQLHGPDAEVRIKTPMVFEVRDKCGMTYREFAVLCAIYSVIGEKRFAIVTRELIQARAAGYKSPGALKSAGSARNLLTPWQVRDTVDKLHQRGLFARCHPNRRQTYFSNRLTDAELREEVFRVKAHAADFRREQAAKDRALMAKIDAANGAVKGTTTTKPPLDRH